MCCRVRTNYWFPRLRFLADSSGDSLLQDNCIPVTNVKWILSNHWIETCLVLVCLSPVEWVLCGFEVCGGAAAQPLACSSTCCNAASVTPPAPSSPITLFSSFVLPFFCVPNSSGLLKLSCFLFVPLPALSLSQSKGGRLSGWIWLVCFDAH